MGALHSLIAYPLFRLTICLATGIFLFDTLWSENFSWSYWVAIWLLLVIVCGGVFWFSRWRWRWLFGVMAGMAFFLWGGISVVHQRETVQYDWDGEPAIYKGIVESVPEVRGKTFRAEVRVDVQRLSNGNWKRIDRNILLSWMPDSLSKPLACGDSVCFYAKVSYPFSEKELTRFDYGDYLLRKSISGTALAYAGNWRCTGKPRSLSVSQLAKVCQQQVVDVYRSWGFDQDVQAVVSALTIGEKTDLTPELKAMYSAAGVSHVLALSGLHVGILSCILLWLFYPLTYLKHGRKMLALLVVCLLWGFAFISGLSSSVVRAVVMYSLYTLASFCLEERFSGMHSLVLAAFLMLIYNPFFLFDISFQLSFTAVFSILAFYPLFSRWLCIKNCVLRYVWNTLSLSISAQLGTLPFILYYFGSFPTYFLLANLVVVILAGGILMLTLVALCVASVPMVGSTVMTLLEWCTSVLNESTRWVQQLDGSQITSVYLSSSQACLLTAVIICFYLCWASGIHRKASDWIRLLMVCNLFVVVSCVEYTGEAPEQLYFFRSEVYTRKRDCVSTHRSETGLLCIRNVHIAVLDDARWRTCESSLRLPLEYAYICRGFKGSLSQLDKLFVIRQVILDSSLSDAFREKLIRECQLLKISYTDLSIHGSYSVVL
ncbi:ComEC family competence protein [Phocaeicola plebeius]|uniref:ComEC family competence protein n=1 Tax=Phocaeicola plebeius TaxID=310297 RepID=A0A3E4ZD67_9BACT|nr:ComEC/Rec2 family competence protein [Phocaeicola plebeius]RGM92989.1 ComEC family competence protein [Phocaeicola plebeius]